MTLKKELMMKLQAQITENYESQLGGTKAFEDDNEGILLVNQNCWRKITYNFSKLGPEILFFCQKDQLTDCYMPDLEPISVNIRQFDHDLIEFKAGN